MSCLPDLNPIEAEPYPLWADAESSTKTFSTAHFLRATVEYFCKPAQATTSPALRAEPPLSWQSSSETRNCVAISQSAEVIRIPPQPMPTTLVWASMDLIPNQSIQSNEWQKKPIPAGLHFGNVWIAFDLIPLSFLEIYKSLAGHRKSGRGDPRSIFSVERSG